LQAVVELMKEYFGQNPSSLPSTGYIRFSILSHIEHRFSCFVESEAAWSVLFSLFILVVSLNLSSNAPLYVFLLVQKKQLGVVISCKMPAGEIRTVKEYKDSLTKSMLHSALNQRLLKPSQERSLCFHFPSGVDALILLVKS
jgi:hypothetical protein